MAAGAVVSAHGIVQLPNFLHGRGLGTLLLDLLTREEEVVAALIAAAERPTVVRAVVSRGGRPDLAGAALPKVTAPTLLIVGGHDEPVIDLNEEARGKMQAAHVVKIVPGRHAPL